MTTSRRFAAAFGVAAVAITGHGLLSQVAVAQERWPIETRFIDTQGEAVGTATLRNTPEGVLIEAEVYLTDGGPHAGDMPNQYVGEDGVMRAQVFNSFVRPGEGSSDITGRALVVRADSDDYESQLAGEADNRLVCALVE